MKKTLAVIVCLAAIFACLTASADEYRMFILCNPKTPVIVRKMPKKGSAETGRLDFGDSVITDGRKRNGYIHVIGITENGEGWVHAGYVVEDQPTKTDHAWANVAASGRVKSYTRIGGKRCRWLAVGDEVKVYALSEEWAVTNKGYIRLKYLEVWYE